MSSREHPKHDQAEALPATRRSASPPICAARPQTAAAVTLVTGIAFLAASLLLLSFRRRILDGIHRATQLRMYDPTTGQGKRTYWLSFVVRNYSDPHGRWPPRRMRIGHARPSSAFLGAREPVIQTDAGTFPAPRTVCCEHDFQHR